LVLRWSLRWKVPALRLGDLRVQALADATGAMSFIEFIRANGTPVPVASPPRLVVSGCYRYVRNPIYVGFMAILLGEVLVFGSRGLLEYTAVAWCIGAAAVRFYEEPILARKFGAEYQDYRHAVRAWIPRLHPWTPSEPARPAAR
jgi:protein-S-isoprenylcysteine O-methyltransferase Ste14